MMQNGKNFGSNSIRIGGNVLGSIVSAGHDNTHTLSEGALDNGHSAAAAALTEIVHLLENLSGPHAAIAVENAQAATTEVNKPKADKPTIAARIEAAIESAKKVSEFGEVSAKLLPQLGVIAAWLGENWQHIGRLI